MARFVLNFNKSPDKLGSEDVGTYLLHLVQEYRWVVKGPEVVEDIGTDVLLLVGAEWQSS